MTPRERFIAALERRPLTGLVPHFELVFFLTMEALGRVHPQHRCFHEWQQMTEHERELHRADLAATYIAIAERYEWSAIFITGPQFPDGRTMEEHLRIAEHIRRLSGARYFLCRHGDATYAIPGGDRMAAFSYRLADEPQAVKDEADRRVDRALAEAEQAKRRGVLDGYILCADYCFNTGPFLSPDQFGMFIFPYLRRLITGYRELGFYAIKHTDGNIMPILDQLVEAEPHALHSLDPQGGVDLAEVKRRVGDRVALCGNVNCGLMDTGTDEQVIASVRYALRHGMPGDGYIFCTSNCIYPGMQLDRYELMLEVWRREGRYPASVGD